MVGAKGCHLTSFVAVSCSEEHTSRIANGGPFATSLQICPVQAHFLSSWSSKAATLSAYRQRGLPKERILASEMFLGGRTTKYLRFHEDQLQTWQLKLMTTPNSHRFVFQRYSATHFQARFGLRISKSPPALQPPPAFLARVSPEWECGAVERILDLRGETSPATLLK